MPVSESLLHEVVARTLLESAFMFATPAPAGPVPAPRRVTIPFVGPEPGELVLVGDGPFSSALAANLLGLEPDDPEIDAVAGPALAELSNILAGLLIAMAWPGAGCRLGLPHAAEAEPGTDPLVSATFLVDDLYALTVAVHPPAPGSPR